MQDKPAVEGFLQRYGTALSSGDLDGIASCWEVPALVLSDQGAIAVDTEKQIREFFGAAVKMYQQQGLESTYPLAVNVTELSPRVLSVDVTWSVLDVGGKETLREHSQYLLRLDDAGQPRIRAAISRPVEGS
jgi:hypothetical protein